MSWIYYCSWNWDFSIFFSPSFSISWIIGQTSSTFVKNGCGRPFPSRLLVQGCTGREEQESQVIGRGEASRTPLGGVFLGSKRSVRITRSSAKSAHVPHVMKVIEGIWETSGFPRCFFLPWTSWVRTRAIHVDPGELRRRRGSGRHPTTKSHGSGLPECHGCHGCLGPLNFTVLGSLVVPVHLTLILWDHSWCSPHPWNPVCLVTSTAPARRNLLVFSEVPDISWSLADKCCRRVGFVRKLDVFFGVKHVTITTKQIKSD